MSQVSRPMQIALVATLVLFAVWFVALRPRPATVDESASPAPAPAQTSSGAAPGTSGLKGAIDQAHDAVTTANGDAARAGGTSADGAAPAAPARSQPSAGGGAASAPRASRAQVGASAGHRADSARIRTVKAALHQHKAVVIAFVDPRTADARAVAQEVQHVSTFDGRAVALAVPLAQLSDYGFITNEVEVTVAPTVVIVDPRRRATTIVGFADRGEIEQRLADALAVKRR